ncbi:SDR family oxidoreductase [Nibrella viscosa]|uniref:SDR family oxidoreductase n=1 Tax=Nibrella viscosa TaxID=1084524 RepID=A0ABP8L130_9BACT
MHPTISILGCGWLGLPLAERLLSEGYTVKGSTTSAEKLPLLTAKGIDAYKVQLTHEPQGNLADLLNAEILLIDIPPKAGRYGDNFHPAQIQQVVEAVRQSPVRWVLYISSTSVYPEQRREVTEEAVTNPELSAAPSLVQAEQLVQRLLPERQTTILRCGGLMGYDRIPGKYIAGKTVDSGAVPVNYIHRDDAVGIITSVLEQHVTGVFNVVAPEHPTREEIYRKSCADFGYAPPTFVEPNEPIAFKIISSKKVKETTGYTFKYPNPLDFYYGQ